MTTKQIAAVVGKEERTVRRWVAKASDKMSEGERIKIIEGDME